MKLLLASLFENFETLTADFKQRDGQPSSTNSSADGIEETIIIEIDKDKQSISRGIFRTQSNI